MAGTSIRITAGGVTADAVMVYTSAGQAAAILPSRVAPGDASLTVTHNSQTSAPARIRVARSSFGIFTRNQGGSGPGILQNYVSATEQPLNGLTEAAHPAQVMILWGTGLGPVDFDETQPPQVKNLDVDLEVLVAGKSVPVLYKGRSPQFPGIDQINFQLPADAPEGCYVPVAVRAGGVVSNFTTISVAASGRVCSDPMSFSASDMETVRSTGLLRMVLITLSKLTVLNVFPGVYDEADSNSKRWDQASLLKRTRIGHYALPYGTCTVVSSGVKSDDPLNITENPGSGGEVPIDDGSSLNLNGPRGSKQGQNGGSPHVGAYRATLTLPVPPTWTNHSSISAVNRSSAGGQSMPSGWLQVNSVSIPVLNRFQAPGLDAGSFGYAMSNLKIVRYQ